MPASKLDCLRNSADKCIIVGLECKGCEIAFRVTVAVDANEVPGYAAVAPHLDDGLSYLPTFNQQNDVTKY